MIYYMGARKLLFNIKIRVLLLCVTYVCNSCVTLAVAGDDSGVAGQLNFSIYKAPGEYCAWPSLIDAGPDGILVFFVKSEEHLGPDGAICMVRSTDRGSTWGAPTIVFDTPVDDREAGVTLLRDGRILIHLRSTFHTVASYDALPHNSYEDEVLARWKRLVSAKAYATAKDQQGSWQTVSTDGGKTWSKPMRGKDSIHGGIEMDDGTLLVASYRDELDSIGVYSSASTSSPWRRIATVASPQPDSLRFGEPHILQLPSGRVIMMIRVTSRPYNDQDPRCVMWESFSDDRGKTWATPYATPLWGFPPHITLLSDGRVLCTYGYRRPPYGQRACTSEDGISWEVKSEIILRDDAPNGDLGYPASIELDPGRILTVYYQPDVPPGTVQRMHPPDPHRTKPGILGTIWTLPSRSQ